MAIALTRPVPIPLIGWARIVTRILAMSALLIACVPLYYVCRALDLRNPLPRVFLGGISWIAGVELRMTGSLFTLVNPGGLYGISVERLGIHRLTSARNARMRHRGRRTARLRPPCGVSRDIEFLRIKPALCEDVRRGAAGRGNCPTGCWTIAGGSQQGVAGQAQGPGPAPQR